MKNIVVKKSRIHGKGIFANRDFKKGEIVTRWDKSNDLTRTEIRKLPKHLRNHICEIEGGKYIIQKKPYCYVNHSCKPNTKEGKGFDIAIRNIKKGEEITSNYGKSYFGETIECECGSKSCKKKIFGIDP